MAQYRHQMTQYRHRDLQAPVAKQYKILLFVGDQALGKGDEQPVQPFWLTMDMARRQLGLATLQLGRECGK